MNYCQQPCQLCQAKQDTGFSGTYKRKLWCLKKWLLPYKASPNVEHYTNVIPFYSLFFLKTCWLIEIIMLSLLRWLLEAWKLKKLLQKCMTITEFHALFACYHKQSGEFSSGMWVESKWLSLHWLFCWFALEAGNIYGAHNRLSAIDFFCYFLSLIVICSTNELGLLLLSRNANI